MYLEPSIWAEFTLFGDFLAVGGDDEEVRVGDHVSEVGLRLLLIILQPLCIPLETEGGRKGGREGGREGGGKGGREGGGKLENGKV